MIRGFTAIAGQAAIDLEAGQGDDFAIRTGGGSAGEEPIDQQAGIAAVAAVAGIDGEDFQIFFSIS